MSAFERIHLTSIDSTNEEAKRRYHKGTEHSILISADEQTKGKGRNGRSFYSPANTGIYFSFLYPNPERKELKELIFVTTVAAVAVCEAVNRYAHVDSGIKWVNDVYLDGKKICGILAEAEYAGSYPGIIVGVGINLTTKDFPKEIRETASGICDIDGEELKRLKESILSYVGEELYRFFTENDREGYREGILKRYTDKSLVIGKRVFFTCPGEKEAEGVATDIRQDGSLVVSTPEGEQILNSGEIHLRL